MKTYYNIGSEGWSNSVDWNETIEAISRSNFSRNAKSSKFNTKSHSVKLITNNGLVLYYSYRTAIGFEWNGHKYMTSRKYSVTTSKHQAWLRRYGCMSIPEDEFREKLYHAILDSKSVEILKKGIDELAQKVS